TTPRTTRGAKPPDTNRAHTTKQHAATTRAKPATTHHTQPLALNSTTHPPPEHREGNAPHNEHAPNTRSERTGDATGQGPPGPQPQRRSPTHLWAHPAPAPPNSGPATG